MAKRTNKWLVLGVALVILLVIVTIAYGESEPAPSDELDTIIGPAISSIEFQTNRFTQPDSPPVAIEAMEIGNDYRLLTENEFLELYIQEGNLALKIRDKRSGYVWSSIPSQEDIEAAGLNRDWQDNVQSPVIIRYLSASAQVRTGNMASLNGKIEEFNQLVDGFQATLVFEDLEASFDLIVRLDGDSIIITIPEDSIVESGEQKLYTLQAYSFLGAALEDRLPGYLFIPDGSGALIRFQADNPHYDDPFARFIYGSDPSVITRSSRAVLPQPISLPVFGMVHGEGQNGFVAIVEQGKYDAEILAYPSGITTDLNWVTTRFTLRHRYFQPTSQNMGGINTFQRNRIPDDKQVRYVFLSGNDASYVGMAKAYRTYLQERDILEPIEQAQEEIPVQIEFLGAEMEPGLIRRKTVEMTTFEQVLEIVRELEEREISNIAAVYHGWSKGGLTGRNPDKFPIENSIGGARGLQELQAHLNEKEITLHLSVDYVQGFSRAKQFNPRVNAIRSITNQVLTRPLGNFFSNRQLRDIDVYYINPSKAYELALKDMKEFDKLNVQGLAAIELGATLLSDNNRNNRVTRREAARTYQDLAQLLADQTGSLGLYSPNDYLFKYTNQIYNVPMSSSQYMYVTDTVPFLQIVLNGMIDYYVAPVNFEANPQEQALRMIEYGAYPSYYLTHERAWNLKNTASNHIFTSYYADWLDFIEESYMRINRALAQVQTATIEERSVLDWGVVRVSYSNGLQIYVNYTEKDYLADGQLVGARDFLVTGGVGE